MSVIEAIKQAIDKISEARKANSELLRQSTPGSIQHRHHETIDDHLFGALALIDGQ